MAHAQDHGALRQADLRGVVIEREKSNSGLRAQTNRGRTYVNLGAGILVRPEIVAGHHGTIGYGSDPIIFASWTKRN